MLKKRILYTALSLCMVSAFSVSAFAVNVDGGEWEVGYTGDNIIYSRYQHETKSHGASTQVWNGKSWDTDRICKQSGVVARSEQKDNYRHSRYHGHGYHHICGADIKDCNGARGIFD